MPVPTQTLNAMIARGRGLFRTALPFLPGGLKQFIGNASRALAGNLWGIQKSLELLDLDIVPSSQTSSATLAGWAFLLGLPNGAGSYGPLVPTLASGGVATLTGVLGTVYPQGAIATGPDGKTQISLSASVTIPGGPGGGLGSISGAKFSAVTAGSAGNIGAGSICTWQSAPPGADPTFTLTSPLTGAFDTETNAQVFARILARLQNPPRGGTSGDYKIWAELVATITGVYIFPRREGTGTVDVLVTISGSGIGRVPTNVTQLAVQQMIDSLRPVAAESVNVLLAFTAPAGHAVKVRSNPVSSTAFDWGQDVPGTAFTVDTGGFVLGPPATIKLTGLAPASLKNAINAFIAGTAQKPRLQVISTGSVVNLPIGVVSFSDAGGKTTLTLDTAPTGWVHPSDGDIIYPYGNLVGAIAPGVLALCDALGPSRQSGLADPFNVWQDTLSINQIARVAEEATDASGNAYVVEVPTGGVTVDGGTTDVQAADALVGQAPELLYLKSVAVTQ